MTFSEKICDSSSGGELEEVAAAASVLQALIFDGSREKRYIS